MSTQEKIWVAIGLIGQAMFSMRFVLQWLASEKQKKSVIPITFYLSARPGVYPGAKFWHVCVSAQPVFHTLAQRQTGLERRE